MSACLSSCLPCERLGGDDSVHIRRPQTASLGGRPLAVHDRPNRSCDGWACIQAPGEEKGQACRSMRRDHCCSCFPPDPPNPPSSTTISMEGGHRPNEQVWCSSSSAHRRTSSPAALPSSWRHPARRDARAGRAPIPPFAATEVLWWEEQQDPPTT